jgi:ferric enterobactin receptor
MSAFLSKALKMGIPRLLSFIIIAGLSAIFPNLYSQNISNIRLDGWMCCNLDNALTEISGKHQVRFEYNVEMFKGIAYTDHPMNKPLSLFLDQICKENKMKYYISPEDSIIHIVDKWYSPDQELLKAPKNFKDAPVKFDFSLSGRIIDKSTREPLPFVAIVIKGTTTGTTSNVDGFFTLIKVPTDTSTLLFKYIGYQKTELFLNPGINANGIFVEMEPEILGLEEVVISTEKQDILQVSGTQTSMIKMSPLKLNTIPNLGEKDILRSFQLMPGISAANENSSGLYVRGGTPDQVLVQYDGFTVYNVEHMFGFFSAFNSNAIKDVQLYKGGFNAKYGGRLSSVVEITGKEGDQKGFNGAVDLSMMSANGYFEIPVKQKISLILAARRSWKSPLYNKIFDQFSTQTDQAVPPVGRFGGANSNQKSISYFYDLNGKITYRPNKSDILAFSIYNGKDKLDNSISPPTNTSNFGGGNFRFNSETTDLTKWGNTGSSLKWSQQKNERFYLNSLLSFSNYYSLRDRSTSGSFTRGDDNGNISRGLKESNNLIDLTAKTDIEYKLSQQQQLGFGLQITHNKIEYSYIQNDTLKVIDKQSKGEIYSSYAEDKVIMFKNKLVITPGIRYNYFTGTSKSYFEPRLNLNYQVNNKFKIKGAIGNYYQFARRVIREDITEGSRDFWVLSDSDKLPVSSAWHYIAGFAFETPNYLFDVEGFYKDLKNVTEYSLRIEQERGSVNYNENFFTGTGISKGFDFLAQKKYGDLTGWIGYTISRVTSRISEFGDYDYYASQDVTHEFKSVFSYKWRIWNFGATWIYATGRPYTAPEGGYRLNLLDGNTADYINVSVKNGSRLPDYHRLDLSANLNFIIGEKLPATLGFSVFNIYNRANVWYKEYEIVENQIIETPVYYLGITPNISFTLKFK